MAETIEPGDRDEITSDQPANDLATKPVNDPAVEFVEVAGEAEPQPEAPAQSADVEQSGLEPGHTPEGVPDEVEEFAGSVVSGLEQLEIEEHEALVHAGDAGGGHEAPEVFFAGWDGLDIPEPVQVAGDSPAGLELDLASLQTLSAMGSASAALLSAYADGPASEMGKHDELAEAVQAALLSVYGSSATEGPAVPHLAFPEEALSPAMDRNADLGPGADDGLSPQDVILNYFDYNPAAPNGNGHAPRAFEPDDNREGATGTPPRQRPDFSPRQSGTAGAARPEWRAPPAPAYEGPPSFPVPTAPAPAAVVPTAHESSRFLGAVAMGLIGGIAIAASLAAFLIYGGPHPGLDIPGIGNLRLDREEQGYGRAAPEESLNEAGKMSSAKAAVEFTSEVLAADVVTTPGQPTSLAISVRSPQPFERTLVSITGVPEGGRLSAGVDAGSGNWLLPPRRLNGLTIALPIGTAEAVHLEAQLLDSNARTPLSAKSQFVVHVKPAATPLAAQGGTPAMPLLAQAGKAPAPVYALTAPAAPQPPAEPAATSPAPPPADTAFRTQTISAVPTPPVAAPFQAALVPGATSSGKESTARRAPRPEVEDLIREGNKRMREGDILEARQFYQKAVAFGDPEAALAMGRSYDPIYFARIDKKNAEPDAAKAFDWYRRAMDAGASQTAMVRIENLKHFLNE
jgi:hypothetical protein